jgi:hypothetical protein
MDLYLTGLAGIDLGELADIDIYIYIYILIYGG